MISNFFYVDWIFIDTIIIILLLLLLIGVRFFKSLYRWRLSFSNSKLEHFSFHNPDDQFIGQNIRTKYWTLTKNTSKVNSNLSHNNVIIIRTMYEKKLLRILTEGLASYGLNVISIKTNNKKELQQSNDDRLTLLSKVINNSKEKGLIKSLNYTLLEYSNLRSLEKKILSDSNNRGMIILNPKITNSSMEIQEKILNNQQLCSQLYYIFSKKSFFFLSNSKLRLFRKKFENKDKINLIILEKSNRNFKYYETILLGILLDIIDNKTIKSTEH